MMSSGSRDLTPPLDDKIKEKWVEDVFRQSRRERHPVCVHGVPMM